MNLKKILENLLIVVMLIFVTGCGKNDEVKLEGNDLDTYNLMLEVCYVAKDPSKISIISGTISDDLGIFKVSYNNGESVYNVLVSKENNEYVVEKLDDSLVSTYKDLLYATDDFDASKVNKALRKKWNN